MNKVALDLVHDQGRSCLTPPKWLMLTPELREIPFKRSLLNSMPKYPTSKGIPSGNHLNPAMTDNHVRIAGAI
jgi:hypothetical protein